ncbi:MAG: DNA repair protein RecO [Gemmatimonadaceae bacterium]
MPLVSTVAIVLHGFDYSETSRILRLATRDAGVLSVLARGARRSTKRFGSALDLFAEGMVQVLVREQRDLQTLCAFDPTRSRPALAADLGRFAGASALAELVLRFATDEVHESLFDALSRSLDDLAASEPSDTRAVTLAGAWRLVGELGFAPSLEACSACHGNVSIADALPFSHAAGGVLCRQCARLHPASRTLPPAERARLGAWMADVPTPPLSDVDSRAHQRLLREFLREHLAQDRALRAFEMWEQAPWGTTA